MPYAILCQYKTFLLLYCRALEKIVGLIPYYLMTFLILCKSCQLYLVIPGNTDIISNKLSYLQM